MKTRIAFALLTSFLIFTSCENSNSDSTIQLLDSANTNSTTTDPDTKPGVSAMDRVSDENIARFFSSNFHLVGNNPCMYYDALTDEYVISGKKLFTRIKAENRKDAIASFHEFLCVRGYSPDGDSARDEFQKAEMNGKTVYLATMDDLLPKMTPEEEALFKGNELADMKKISGSDAYHYLGTIRNCPVVYASSGELTLEGKNLQKNIKMDSAKYALKTFCNYVDEIRKEYPPIKN